MSSIDITQLGGERGSTQIGIRRQLDGAPQRTLDAWVSDAVDIRQYGADPTGQFDCRDALLRALDDCRDADGHLIRHLRGDGKKYYFTGPTVVDGAESSIDGNGDNGTAFKLELGQVGFPATANAYLDFANMRRPNISMHVLQGGNDTDDSAAIRFRKIEGLKANIFGSAYLGTLVQCDAALGKIIEILELEVWARSCRRAIVMRGKSAAEHNPFTGSVKLYDIFPRRGSIFENLDDLTLSHVENNINRGFYAAGNLAAEPSITITNCDSLHIGLMALGNGADVLAQINGGINGTAGELFMYGGNDPPATRLCTGLHIYDTELDVGKISAVGNNIGVLHEGGGSILTIDKPYYRANNADVILQQGLGAGQTVYHRTGPLNSADCYTESIKTVGVVSGELEVAGGRIKGGNVSGGATTAAIDTSSAGGGLIVRLPRARIDAEYPVGVRVYDAKLFLAHDCDFRCATSGIDTLSGRKITKDGRTILLTAGNEFEVWYANNELFPFGVTQPFRFVGGQAIAGDWAEIQVRQPGGTVMALTDRRTCQVAATTDFYEALHAVVPSGWAYQVLRSNAARVVMTGTPYLLKL